MIINSLLDSDLYKFSMQQCVLHQFPNVDVEYKFKCRNNKTFTKEQIERIKIEIQDVSKLKFKEDELRYLLELPYIKKDYVQFLRNFKLNSDEINIKDVNGMLDIRIKGKWINTILWEILVLSIVNEILA